MPFLSFQFHKGAIRTLLVKLLLRLLQNFNSIKVRLELLTNTYSDEFVPISIP